MVFTYNLDPGKIRDGKVGIRIQHAKRLQGAINQNFSQTSQ